MEVFQKPKEEPLPKPKPPVGIPTKGTAGITKPKPIGSTRSKTVVAGDLTPGNIFKHGKLGR